MADQPIPLLEESDAKTAAVEAGLMEILGETSLFQVCLHHPPIAQLVAGVVEKIVYGSALDPRLRELAILRTGWRMKSVYEFTNHAIIAVDMFGASEDDVRGVRNWREHPGFGEDERLVLAAVDEAIDDDVIAEKTVAACQARFGDQALLELVLIPGLYRSVATLLHSLRVPLETGRKPWWPDGVAPEGWRPGLPGRG